MLNIFYYSLNIYSILKNIVFITLNTYRCISAIALIYVRGANEQAYHLMVSDHYRPGTATSPEESQVRSL